MSFAKESAVTTKHLNVLGQPLELCCEKPKTGFYRDGYCTSGEEDRGRHVVCAQVTQEFLDFTLSKGNDLITPSPANQFPGLKPGDKWCLCALRWREAFLAGKAPPLFLESTDKKALDFVTLENLKAHKVK